jgi:GT2 family glycosyltransferase
MTKTKPLVSCVVVYHAQPDLLRQCLSSFEQQTFSDRELIVVNTSSKPLETQSLMLENRGYGHALNRGCELAKGDYLLLLNADVLLPPDSLERLVSLAESSPNTIFSPHTYLPDGSLDTIGNQMHYTALTSRSRMLSETCTLSGAALFVSNQVWQSLGGFDEDYFLYHEDTDFCLRARLLGIALAPCDVGLVIHDSPFTLDSQKFYLLERNRLMLLCKLYQTKTLLKLLPALCLTSLATLSYAILHGMVGAWLRAWGWLWKHRVLLLKKRRLFQQQRQFSDSVFLSYTRLELPFAALSRHSGWLNTLTTPLYRLFFWLAT